ncbi:MAG TPA: CHAT domain-containing protein [Streptosporangiaceae bacterium]|nr:CHAT domain-containing protein [Streptosporangiaceae bacterium]
MTVTWQQDGRAPRAVVSTFPYQVGTQEAEKIRWYLEDYAEFPADPAPALAADAEARLSQLGTGLFRQVFNSQDAAVIWGQAQSELSRVRVEVDTDPADTPGLPWELARDPNTDTALALGAGTFVRTHLQTAGQVRLPEAAGDQLRVLLVICRPRGREDVPFRSVASRLVRGGAGRMEGLQLDVLRPATYLRLAEVLHQAVDAGRPYHIVHFDGHGTYLDLANLGPERDDGEGDGDAGQGAGGGGVGLSPLRYGISLVGSARPGQHGYLIFEDANSPTNQQLADGRTLGRLLTETEVPVLVLNACRSAYAEAPARPVDPGSQAESSAEIGTEAADHGMAGLADDVHARIRAYGSLAAEVADTGVPGVVAMRYNVYVVTAAQYMADLYAHLLAGKSFGEAATAARRALAGDPDRHIGGIPVALQDWAVPVVYEAAPLTLLEPAKREAPLIHLAPTDSAPGDSTGDSVPRPPDAGFFGRDETLLTLDRAFDTQQVVLLHAFAGAGKTTTGAEFARWYQATGGLHHRQLGAGPVLWSSFEHHLPLDRLLDTVGDAFSSLLEANGIHWQTLTDPAQRYGLVLQLLAQVPTLWVWDNVEPVTGFPPGARSAWSAAEQDQIVALLRDLAQQTCCKVLLTSRRDERHWLGDLPARVQLAPMPMRERLQLAYALAARHSNPHRDLDWRPLLRYTAGNPLTISVLVSQALRDNLTTTADLQAFVARLQAGEQELEPGEDAALGRSRSLAASLSYGFSHAFTGTERAQLAVLHLFRGSVDADALRLMGDQDLNGDDAVPQLAGLGREGSVSLLDRAASIGLLSPLGGGYYSIHPALPWYFAAIYAATFGQPGAPGVQRATRAYIHTIASLGNHYHNLRESGAGDSIPALRIEEDNLLLALGLGRQAQLWDDVTSCLQGLRLLYEVTGRDAEWARLVRDVTPDFIDLATDGPLPGRENDWNIVTGYRVRLAREGRDWPTAERLQLAVVTWDRDQAAAALTMPPSELDTVQRTRIRNLAVDLEQLGHILRRQNDPGCLPHYLEGLSLAQRAQDRPEECRLANALGNAYMEVRSLRNLDEAERWHQRSLGLEPAENRIGRGQSFVSLGNVAYQRFMDGLDAQQAEPVLLEHLNAALRDYEQALTLLPADDLTDLGATHGQLGLIYSQAGDIRQALYHLQQSIKCQEAHGGTYHAGMSRYNIALLLADAERPGDALLYARAALHDFERVGSGAARDAADARDLIARLNQDS